MAGSHMTKFENFKQRQLPPSILHVALVSAASLTTPHPPSSLPQHFQLPSHDGKIWDDAYAEEYFGLHTDTKAWEYIFEEEYQHLLLIVGCDLPSFALATIKYDEHGCPHCAKYCICVLGNLNPMIGLSNNVMLQLYPTLNFVISVSWLFTTSPYLQVGTSSRHSVSPICPRGTIHHSSSPGM
eukprot:1262346-Ditylum_brightwellii.AAC.2